MSNVKTEKNPTVETENTENVINTETPETETPQKRNPLVPVFNFVKEKKTWIVGGLCLAGGFVLHGFLSDDEPCELEYDDWDEIEGSDTDDETPALEYTE